MKKAILFTICILFVLTIGTNIIAKAEQIDTNRESNLIKVKDQRGDFYINEEYKSDIILFFDEQAYVINEKCELENADIDMISTYATFSHNFTLKNGAISSFSKYAQKGTQINVRCDGPNELRRLIVAGDTNIFDGTYDRPFGFAFTADSSREYIYALQNCCPITKTWTVSITY